MVTFFNEDNHLNEEGIALYCDAMREDNLEKLPDDVCEHVEDCFDCKKEIIELYDILSDIDKSKKNEQSIKKLTSHNTYQIGLKLAAVFTGLIAIGIVLYILLFKGTEYDKLYADNFQPYPDIVTSRSVFPAEVDSKVKKVIAVYYNQEKYDSANYFFDLLYSKGQRSDILLFYYGNSCLSNNEFEKAINLFLEADTNETNLFEEQVKWYLALAYLGASVETDKKNNDVLLEESRKILMVIALENTSYSSHAKNILEKL